MPQMPPLKEDVLRDLLAKPLVAKIATLSSKNQIRITPIWFGRQDDGSILLNTWDTTAAVRNLRRNPTCSLLVDTTDFPYTGVHFWGTGTVEGPENDPDAIAKLFERYRGDFATAREYAEQLIGYSIGNRVFIRFRPERHVGWDFSQG